MKDPKHANTPGTSPMTCPDASVDVLTHEHAETSVAATKDWMTTMSSVATTGESETELAAQ